MGERDVGAVAGGRTHRTRWAGLLVVVAVVGGTLLPTAERADAAAGFPDVPAGAYYTQAVAWLVGQGITTGVGDTGRFMPDRAVDRGQMVTFLWRFAGSPGGSPRAGFPDVPRGAYYAAAVDWARANGITTGVGSTGRFQPGLQVDRGQMVTFLWRLFGSPGGSPRAGFPDVPRGAYYAAAVDWARANGITTGVGSTGRFAPGQVVSRAQMATFLFRASDLGGPSGLGSALYDVVLEGNVFGRPFRRTALLGVFPTVTRVGTQNGVNPVEVCLVSGFPAANPQRGAIWLNSNSACVSSSTGADLDLGFVTVNGNAVGFEPDGRIAGTQNNGFNALDGVAACIYAVNGGSAVYRFDGNRVRGSIGVNGYGGAFCGNAFYSASVTGTRR